MALEVPTSYPVNFNAVNGKSYATLYLPFDVQTDADTKAFYASTADNGKLTLVDLNGNIPAQTAVVLINSNAAANTTFNVATGLSSVVTEADNLLKGTLVDMTLDLGDTTPYYSLGVNEGKVGFYKFNNSGTTTITLGANKAYLEVSGSLTPSKGFTFSFDETSSLDNLTIDNLTIGEEGIYDLLGRKVGLTPDPSPKGEGSKWNLPKGIYIVNGKKIVVK